MPSSDRHDFMSQLTAEVSDRRRQRTQAVSDDVHKFDRVKTETISGGLLDSLGGFRSHRTVSFLSRAYV